MTTAPAYTVVIPTTGRESLPALLHALDEAAGPAPAEIIVVDDRPDGEPLRLPELSLPVRLQRCGGRGPAAARNVGWRQARTEWVAFLDDDVLIQADWRILLAADLTGLLEDTVAGSTARIVVPLPGGGRRPTDDERGTAGLMKARWITADVAYRRSVLAEVGGFDERFPHAYREDADLALRVLRLGLRIVPGTRTTVHPTRRAGFFASVKAQAGNADNALLRRKYGRSWRRLIGEGPGRTGRHAVATLSALAAILLGKRQAAALAAGLWVALTAEFALRRILPGPRTPSEVARMAVSSVLIPPIACWHRAAGEIAARRPVAKPPAAVLFDRDDTIIVDQRYLANPELVRPMPGAAAVLRQLRDAGIPVGVVSNQSGVARGLITPEQLARVNARVDELLGPFGTWQVCVHGEDDGCGCRKPAPELVLRAATELGVEVGGCVMIGDTGADVDAALSAGASAILVPTARTLPTEIEQAHRVARVALDLPAAVGLALGEAQW
jgi:histidinol-phosphate phosphatase family protein